MRDDAPETGVGLLKVTIHATLPDLICATFTFVINHHHYFPYICNVLPFDSLSSLPAWTGFAVHRPSEMNIIVTTILHFVRKMTIGFRSGGVEGWSECYNDDDGNIGCWSAMVRGVGRVV